MSQELGKVDFKKSDKSWTHYSAFTDRHDEVGRCAEENAQTPNCVPGSCELCNHCSCNPQRE